MVNTLAGAPATPVFVPPRLGTARNEQRESLGWVIGEVAQQMGFVFHPWQEHLSDVSMEVIERIEQSGKQSTHRLNAQYVGAMVGRQSGKTAWCCSRIVAQCLMPNYIDLAESMGLDFIQPQNVAYTAQTRTAAVERWHEHIAMMESAPGIADEIQVIRQATGREVVVFHNGSTYRPVTPNKVNPRGLSLDLAIVDEALAHPLWLLGAMRPAQAQRDGAERCIGAQFVVISNAGDDDSELLNRIQELGIESLSDPESRRVWMEWSISEDDEPFDEATWWRTIPTLGQPNGIPIDFLRTEAETMPESQFVREYLCRRAQASSSQIIPTEAWMACARNDVIVPFDGITLGLDVRMDRQGASLVACSMVNDYLPVEVIECKQGLEWVLERTIDVALRHSAVVAIDAIGPAANLIPSLAGAGVMLEILNAPQVTSAAANFYDNVLIKRIAHLNDYRLNDAIVGASRRAVGERWAFDRKGLHDISPLVAASFAAWVAENGSLGMPTIHSNL